MTPLQADLISIFGGAVASGVTAWLLLRTPRPRLRKYQKEAIRFFKRQARPIGENLHDKVFNPAPEVTAEMKREGFTWRKMADQTWRMVCSTCGSNCGQCGSTDKLGNFTQPSSGPSQMDFLVQSLAQAGKPR